MTVSLRSAPLAASLALTFVLLAGCGNKGPLVMPTAADTEAAMPSAAAVDAGAEADPLPTDQTGVPQAIVPVPPPRDPALDADADAQADDAAPPPADGDDPAG